MKTSLVLLLQGLLFAPLLGGCAASGGSNLPGLASISPNGGRLDIAQELRERANLAPSVVCCVYVSQNKSTSLLEYNSNAKGAPICAPLTVAQGMVSIQSDIKHELIVPTSSGVYVYKESRRLCLPSSPLITFKDKYIVDGFSPDGRTFYLAHNNIAYDPRTWIRICKVGRRTHCNGQLTNPYLHNPVAVTADSSGVYAVSALTVGYYASLIYWQNATGPGVALSGFIDTVGGGIYLDGFGNLLSIDDTGSTASLIVYSGCPSACQAHGPFPLRPNTEYGSLSSDKTRFMTVSTDGTIDVYQYNATYGVTFLYSNSTGLNPSNVPIGIAQDT